MVAAEVVVLEVEIGSSDLVEADTEELVAVGVAAAAEMIAVAAGSQSAVAAVVELGSSAEVRNQESRSIELVDSALRSPWAAVQTVTAVAVVVGNY